jgi:hypothetical protein
VWLTVKKFHVYVTYTLENYDVLLQNYAVFNTFSKKLRTLNVNKWTKKWNDIMKMKPCLKMNTVRMYPWKYQNDLIKVQFWLFLDWVLQINAQCSRSLSRDRSLSCHICGDKGHQVFRSHLKEHSIQSYLRRTRGCWRYIVIQILIGTCTFSSPLSTQKGVGEVF